MGAQRQQSFRFPLAMAMLLLPSLISAKGIRSGSFHGLEGCLETGTLLFISGGDNNARNFNELVITGPLGL